MSMRAGAGRPESIAASAVRAAARAAARRNRFEGTPG
jgi:hypothetical protein